MAAVSSASVGFRPLFVIQRPRPTIPNARAASSIHHATASQGSLCARSRFRLLSHRHVAVALQVTGCLAHQKGADAHGDGHEHGSWLRDALESAQGPARAEPRQISRLRRHPHPRRGDPLGLVWWRARPNRASAAQRGQVPGEARFGGEGPPGGLPRCGGDRWQVDRRMAGCGGGIVSSASTSGPAFTFSRRSSSAHGRSERGHERAPLGALALAPLQAAPAHGAGASARLCAGAQVARGKAEAWVRALAAAGRLRR